MLGARGRGVLEFLQGFADSVGHGNVEVIAGVIPVDCQAAVLAARWVDSDRIIVLERVEEVGGVVYGKELDIKVVYSEGECSGQGCVCPKDGGMLHGGVAVGLEVANEALVGNDAGLFQPIHSLPDFDVDISARVDEGEEGVFNDYFVGDVLQVYPYVLVVRHRIVQVIIYDFRPQVTGTFSGVGDDRVEVDLEVEEADCWGAGIAVAGEFFATNC